jgi:hypothetical protein
MRKIPVVLYGAAACHLCHEAEALLGRLAAELGLDVRVVDIGGDAALEQEFRPEIPVVFLGGRKAYKYRIDESDLRRRVERIRAHP